MIGWPAGFIPKVGFDCAAAALSSEPAASRDVSRSVFAGSAVLVAVPRHHSPKPLSITRHDDYERVHAVDSKLPRQWFAKRTHNSVRLRRSPGPQLLYARHRRRD